MQVIFEDENERINSRRVDTVGFDIYVGRSSRCLEIKCDREFAHTSKLYEVVDIS